MNALLMLHFAGGPVGSVLCLIHAAIAGALLIELSYRIGGAE